LHEVDEIYCAKPDVDNTWINELIDFAENNLIRVKFIPDFRGINFRKINIDFYGHFPVITFREIPLDDVLNQITKRTFDIVFSLIILLFVAPGCFPLLLYLLNWILPGLFSLSKSVAEGIIMISGAGNSEPCT
jgi:putative colanic acid biosynthesis UDP-glucose lipid carrier transferase